MSIITLGICQMQVGYDKEENWKKAEQMISRLSSMGAELVILPEIFNSPYLTNAFPEYAETHPGPTTFLLHEWAQKYKICLIGGSIPEIDADKIYNTCFVFNDQGQCLAKYRKIHLFDINITGQIQIKESDTMSPGNELVFFEYKGINIGIVICYDIRFPELSRYLALKGVSLLVVPAAFSYLTGKDHWTLLMQSRAIDNQFYVAAVSPARNPDAAFKIWGHSMLVDPWGKIIQEADETEQAMLVQIDMATVSKVRQELPVLAHRREEIYRF